MCTPLELFRAFQHVVERRDLELGRWALAEQLGWETRRLSKRLARETLTVTEIRDAVAAFNRVQSPIECVLTVEGLELRDAEMPDVPGARGSILDDPARSLMARAAAAKATLERRLEDALMATSALRVAVLRAEIRDEIAGRFIGSCMFEVPDDRCNVREYRHDVDLDESYVGMLRALTERAHIRLHSDSSELGSVLRHVHQRDGVGCSDVIALYRRRGVLWYASAFYSRVPTTYNMELLKRSFNGVNDSLSALEDTLLQ